MELWILGTAFALVGVPFVWIAQRAFARHGAMARWPRVPGTISHAALETSHGTRRNKDGVDEAYTGHRAIVRYVYEVGGEVREGTRISLVDDFLTSRDTAQATLDRFPVDRRVEVFVDPSDPGEAFLETSRSIGAMILLAFGLMWLGIGGLLLGLACFA